MKIDILGVEHEIKFVAILDEDTDMGDYEQEKALIRIRLDMPRQVQDYILAHEIVHAIDDMTKLGLTEHQVCVLGLGLHSILKGTWSKLAEDK